MNSGTSATLALLAFMALASCRDEIPGPAPKGAPPTSQAISSQDGVSWYGPYKHENLQIYIAESTAEGQEEPMPPFVTLSNAIDAKLVRVTEVGAEATTSADSEASEQSNRQSPTPSWSTTSNRGTASPASSHINLNELFSSTASPEARVDTLKIQNLGDKPIFVQQGDIVKGGKQDRVIAMDFVVPPKSEPMDIASFCVEHGRWANRTRLAIGAVNLHGFGNSGTMNSRFVSSNSLKLALKSQDQNAVWSSVKGLKSGLSRNLDQPAQLDQISSPSSFVLMNESATVQDGIKAYTEALSKATARHPNSCGFALVINGRVNSIDVYASPRLFRGHWTKLIHSAATEAVSIQDCEKQDMGTIDPHALLQSTRSDDCKTEKNGTLEHSIWETETAFLTETRYGGRLVHVNWVAKLSPPTPAPEK